MLAQYSFLLFAYFFVTLLNLWAGYSVDENLMFFTKPLLMPLLGIWFYFQTKERPSSFRNLILLALFFSWGGDVLLMFVESKGEHFFLLGLLSFLITHLLYAAAFFKTVSWRNGFLQKNKWAILLFLIIYLGFNSYLLPDVAKDMQIPVGIYSLVIITMVLAALNRNTFVGKKTFQFIFFGALIFMFSDMVIALDKFKSPVPYAHLWIMGLYLLGQYCIVKGCVYSILKIKSL